MRFKNLLLLSQLLQNSGRNQIDLYCRCEIQKVIQQAVLCHFNTWCQSLCRADTSNVRGRLTGCCNFYSCRVIGCSVHQSITRENVKLVVLSFIGFILPSLLPLFSSSLLSLLLSSFLDAHPGLCSLYWIYGQFYKTCRAPPKQLNCTLFHLCHIKAVLLCSPTYF